MRYIKASKLKKGDKVGLVSPSEPIRNKLDIYEEIKNKLEKNLEIQIIPGKNAFNEFYYSAATANERIDDLHEMFRNKTIKAIFIAKGGGTAIDLLELLDYELIMNNPKIICGISDASTLLNAITAQTGLITFLGMEFFDFAGRDMKYEFEYMKKAWLEGKIGKIKPNPNWKNFMNEFTRYQVWRTIKPGIASGKLVGGNFSGFSQLLNTPYLPSLKNNILTIETYQLQKKTNSRRPNATSN